MDCHSVEISHSEEDRKVRIAAAMVATLSRISVRCDTCAAVEALYLASCVSVAAWCLASCAAAEARPSARVRAVRRSRCFINVRVSRAEAGRGGNWEMGVWVRK